MILTNHAISRLQQRGIPQKVSEVIYEFGEPVEKPGGVLAYRLLDRTAHELVHDLKLAINRIEKARHKILVVDDNSSSLITGYHDAK
jgi:hypothetical protein